MPSFCPGDRVFCKIKDSFIVQSHITDFDENLVFYIINHFEHGYLVHVPDSIFLKNSVLVTSRNCREYDMPDAFIGDHIHYITDVHIFKIHSFAPDGMNCVRCDEFFHMSEPNQPDGTMKCWQCRTNPMR